MFFSVPILFATISSPLDQLHRALDYFNQTKVVVVSIGDGDTISVRQGDIKRTVRLACIDAPEISQQPYGSEAKNYLRSRLAIGSIVALNIQGVDLYRRTIAEVDDGNSVNLDMVKHGQAFAYRKYLSKCNKNLYIQTEVDASKKMLGVWSIPGGIERPWDYRKRKKQIKAN